MKKISFRVSDKKIVLAFGAVFLAIELLIFIFLLVLDTSFAGKILSMISANHIVGRLAFIGLGLEYGLKSPLIIFIIIFYNTTYLLILNSLIVYFWEQTKKLNIINHFIESIKKKARVRTQTLKKWNWFSISLFVWLPFPMTGAVMGSLVAYLEGYNIKNALLMVIPSMWIGVICWTLWFDELYEFIEKFGKGKTIILTICLIILPLLFYLYKNLREARRHKIYE
jgi:uncharacterized membrane protein